MMGLGTLIKRNCKLFFKDKGMFFTSLITPLILLVLYVTFLGTAYRDMFFSAVPASVPVDEALIGGMVGGQLVSSLLAVCCVTVAFCSNLLMVGDKVTGARQDLTMAPVRRSTLALGYFVASAVTTLIICFTALAVCLLYLHFSSWYLTVGDVFLLALDVILLVLFGTALSSVVNFHLSTSGQGSAVGTIVSAGYGFLCGAYMPISNFSDGLQKALSFLPGTYGTSLLRNHTLQGVYGEMTAQGYPGQVVETIRDAVDCNLYFFGNRVELGTMYLVLCGAVIVLISGYIALNVFKERKEQLWKTPH
jgi:multidrug/hemolysin transport system permease protein